MSNNEMQIGNSRIVSDGTVEDEEVRGGSSHRTGMDDHLQSRSYSFPPI